MASLRDLVPRYLYTVRLTLQLFDRSEKHYSCLLDALNSATAHATLGDLGVRSPAQFDALNAVARLRGDKFKDGVADADLYYLIRLGSRSPEGELIGGISLCQRVVGAVVLPPDMGWAVTEAQMSEGYATEAAREVLRFVRNDFGVEGVIVLPSAANPRSNRVAEKLGFTDGGQIPDGDRPGQMYNVLILPDMDKVNVTEGFSIKQRDMPELRSPQD